LGAAVRSAALASQAVLLMNASRISHTYIVHTRKPERMSGFFIVYISDV
jgi:hypothetical protein